MAASNLIVTDTHPIKPQGALYQYYRRVGCIYLLSWCGSVIPTVYQLPRPFYLRCMQIGFRLRKTRRKSRSETVGLCLSLSLFFSSSLLFNSLSFRFDNTENFRLVAEEDKRVVAVKVGGANRRRSCFFSRPIGQSDNAVGKKRKIDAARRSKNGFIFFLSLSYLRNDDGTGSAVTRYRCHRQADDNKGSP